MKKSISFFYILNLAALLAVSACSEQGVNAQSSSSTHMSQAHAETHGAGAHAATHDHGHDHTHDGDDHMPKLVRYHQFSPLAELYLERPPLYVGQAAEWVAHVNDLNDFHPVTQGKLSVILAVPDQGQNHGQGQDPAPAQYVASTTAEAPGLFSLHLIPEAAGDFDLTILFESSDGSSRYALGSVPVFADVQEAANAHQHHSHGVSNEGIHFTKAQQWKSDFATAEAFAGQARPSIAATAIIKAQPDGEALLTAPATGVLRAENFVRIGQSVKQGQVLAYLTPRLGGDVDVATLQAAVEKAGISLAQAQRERERLEALFAAEAVPQKRLQAAQDQERLAQAELQAARARQAQLSGAGGIPIRAPIDGHIADVSVSNGAFVAEGSPLLHIANTTRLWLEARIPESELGRLQGQQLLAADFVVDGYAQPFLINQDNHGRLVAIGKVVDATTRTVPAVFEFDQPAHAALRLGMSAQAQLYMGAGAEAVLVPASAIQDENGTSVVYVQIDGERFRRQLVRPGVRDGNQVAILDGLTAGERVVSRGGHLIRLATAMATAVGHVH